MLFFSRFGFLNFCSNIHDKIFNVSKCEEGCEFQKYSDLLKMFLSRHDKCKQEKNKLFRLLLLPTQGYFLDYGNLFRGKEYTFHCLDKILKEN